MAKPAKCARCGRENDPSLAFCLDCGQPLRPPAPPAPRTCTGCGAMLDAAFRFCGHCGAPVQPAAAAAPASASASALAPAPGLPRPPEAAASPAPQSPAAAPAPASAGAAPAPPSPAAAPIRAERPATAGVGSAVPPRTATSGALRLALVRPDGAAGASFALDGEEAICGRAEGAIRLADDPTVSPRHARFTVRARSLAVEDLGTVNGTFVRLQGPRALRAGDEVRVGHQLLRLEPVPPPPEDDGAVRPWGAPDTGARFRLVQLLEGGGVGDAFPLRPGENAIGREAGEVTFPSDRYVSSRHARIEVRGAEVTLSDAGSSNGTFVKIAGAVTLAPGDQLLVGAQLLRVEGAPQG